MNTEMNLEQARSVIWPFRDLKGQTIGTLLDTGQISMQDLGFAAERAWDRRVQMAARTVLVHMLSNPINDEPSAAGPLQVISSDRRTYAEGLQLVLSLFYGGAIGIPLGILIMWLIYIVFLRPDNPSTNAATENISSGMYTLVFILVTAIALFILSMGWKLLETLVFAPLERRIELYRQGQLGEERMVTAMYHFLDGNWKLFRNIELPGTRLGDLDGVLVGPHGVWCLEVKSYNGSYRNTGDKWEYQYRNNWLPTVGNPTKQAKRNAAALGHVLKTHDIQQWVNLGEY